MPSFRFSVRVPLSPERAFALYTNADRLTDWFPKARAVENLTAPMNQPGSRYTIRFDGLPDAKEEILEIVPGAFQRRRFVQSQSGIGVQGDVRIYFRTVDGGTEVEEVVEYGYLPALLSPLLFAFLDKTSRLSMQRELEGFQRLAEAQGLDATSEKSVNANRVTS